MHLLAAWAVVWVGWAAWACNFSCSPCLRLQAVVARACPQATWDTALPLRLGLKPHAASDCVIAG